MNLCSALMFMLCVGHNSTFKWPFILTQLEFATGMRVKERKISRGKERCMKGGLDEWRARWENEGREEARWTPAQDRPSV